MAQTTTSVVSYDTTAYNKQAWFSLRPQLTHEANIVSVKTTPQTHTGAAVQFNLVTDLTATTTALTETADVTSKALSDTNVTITLAEYGDVVETTAKVFNTSFIEFDPLVANAVGYHAGLSIDEIVRLVAVGGTGVAYGGAATSRVTVAAAHTLAPTDIGKLLANLAGANVQTFDDGYYRVIIHPDQEYDLKQVTGEAGWASFAIRQQPQAIEQGTIGQYQGFRVMRSSRTGVLSNAGVGSTVEVYQAVAFGKEALAKGFCTGVHGDGQRLGADPITIPGPFTDALYRFRKMGWYQFAGYGVFRQAALRRLETSSSLAVNV